MANMTKAVFKQKVNEIKAMGFTPVVQTVCDHLIIRFVNQFDEVKWETVCVASSCDVLNRQEKKYLAWFNEA